MLCARLTTIKNKNNSHSVDKSCDYNKKSSGILLETNVTEAYARSEIFRVPNMTGINCIYDTCNVCFMDFIRSWEDFVIL